MAADAAQLQKEIARSTDPKRRAAFQAQLDKLNGAGAPPPADSGAASTADPAQVARLQKEIARSTDPKRRAAFQAKLDALNGVPAQATPESVLDLSTNKLRDALSAFNPNWAPQDWTADRQKVEDDLYNSSKKRLDDQYGQQEQEFQQQMADRGIPIDSQLGMNMRKAYEQNKSDAYQQARNYAQTQAADEEQRLIGNQATVQGVNQGAFNNLSGFMSGLYGLGLQNEQFDKKLAADAANTRTMAGAARAGAVQRDPVADYIAKMNADTQSKKDLMQFDWANNPQYKQTQKPGMGGALGGLLGSFGGSFLGGLGKSWGSKLGG